MIHRIAAAIALMLLAPSAGAQSSAPDFGPVQQALRQGRMSDAEAACRAIVAEHPDAAQGWFLLGYTLHAQGRLAEAIPMHRKALEFPQTRPIAMYNLACALSLQHRTDEAFAALDEANRLGTINADQIRNDTDLNNIRSDPRFEKLLARLESAPDSGVLPESRQLDFWIGQWDVYGRDGRRLGSNIISRELRGNMIRELWTSGSGGRGESVNWYDAVTKTWHQLWISDQGSVLHMQGTVENDTIVFEGEYHFPTAKVSRHRMRLQRLDAGNVWQLIHDYNPDTDAWSVSFDAIYVPSGATPPETWSSAEP